MTAIINNNCFNINPVNLDLTGKVANGIRLFMSAAKSKAVLGALHFSGLLAVPISSITVGKSVNQLISKQTCVSEKIDAGLMIGDSSQIYLNTASNVGTALQTVGAIGEEAIHWVAPVGYACLGMEIFSIALSVKGLIESRQFLKELQSKAALDKEASDYELEDYQQGVAFLEKEAAHNRSAISKHFGVKSEKLFTRLKVIEKDSKELLENIDPKKREEARKTMKETMKTLDKRAKQKKRIHWVNLIASIVGIIATVVLLAAPPLASIGFALAGLATTMAIAKFFIERKNKKAFAKALGINKSAQLGGN